jgi:predicted MFS family arabinose efflux permease
MIPVGGTLASLCGFLCAATTSFPLLVAGRFLQGVCIHPPFPWRYAFVTASTVPLLATLDAGRWLPAAHRKDRRRYFR